MNDNLEFLYDRKREKQYQTSSFEDITNILETIKYHNNISSTNLIKKLDLIEYMIKDKINQNNNDIKIILDTMEQIKEALTEIPSSFKQISSGGGDDGMDDLYRRVENLERSVSAINETLKDKPTSSDLKNTKNEIISELREFIDRKVTSEDRVKILFNDCIKDYNISSKEYVGQQIKDSENKLLKWLIGLGLTSVATLVTLVVSLILKLI